MLIGRINWSCDNTMHVPHPQSNISKTIRLLMKMEDTCPPPPHLPKVIEPYGCEQYAPPTQYICTPTGVCLKGLRSLPLKYTFLRGGGFKLKLVINCLQRGAYPYFNTSST